MNSSLHLRLSTYSKTNFLPNLHNTWSKQPQPDITEKINDIIKPTGSLKPRVKDRIKKLQLQIKKLDSMLINLKERDAKLFYKIIEAIQNHDAKTGRILSNELSEVRKVTKILSSARIALERIELRLITFNDLGDSVVAIMSTMGLMKNLKSSLGKIMFGTEQEIDQMTEMLGGFMTESFSIDTTFGIDESSSVEPEKILQEANGCC